MSKSNEKSNKRKIDSNNTIKQGELTAIQPAKAICLNIQRPLFRMGRFLVPRNSTNINRSDADEGKMHL